MASSSPTAFSSFIGNGTGWAAYLEPMVPLSFFGADPTGTTDSTVAINTAVAESAAHAFTLVGAPRATYKVKKGSSAVKQFKNSSGEVIEKHYAVAIPTGAKVDWQGATLVLGPTEAANENTVVLCNQETAAKTDVISCKNVTVKGESRSSTERAVPMIWFEGLASGSYLDNITVENVSYVAFLLAASSGVKIGRLYAYHITGQGLEIGGNTYYQNTNCDIDLLHAEDVTSYGTFNQPGNGAEVGASQTNITRISSRNCGGGHKIQPGSADLQIGASVFDGTVNAGEPNNGTENSGTKVQGDEPIAAGTATASGTTILTVAVKTEGSGVYEAGQYISGPQIPYGAKIVAVLKSEELELSTSIPAGVAISIFATDAPPPTRITFGDVITRNASSHGFRVYRCGTVSVDTYTGYKNCREGNTSYSDVMGNEFDRLTIGNCLSEWSGSHGVSLTGTNWIGRADIAQLRIRNPADVATSGVNGVIPLCNICNVTDAEIIDDRSTKVVGLSALAATGNNLFRIESYTTNVTSGAIKIEATKHWLGNVKLSSEAEPLQGTLKPSMKATSIELTSNQNVKLEEWNSGYVQPVIQIIAMNEAAQKLGIPRYAISSGSKIKFTFKEEAAGTEVYLYHVLGYTWQATKLA